jgi:PRTRC genetic system protein F
MLALPALPSIPRAYTSATTNPLAAQMALALAGDAELPALSRKDAPEIAALERQLADWLARQNAQMKFLRAGVHLALNQRANGWETDDQRAPDAYTVVLRNHDEEYFGSVWHLEWRFRALEAAAPGLAGAALNAITHAGAHSFHVYAPAQAEYWASYVWWHGCDDESEALAEYRAMEGEDAEPPEDLPTRAAFDKALPRAVTRPRSKLKAADLERIGRRRDRAGEAARGVLAIDEACKAAHRRTKAAERSKRPPFDLESSDEDGFTAMGAMCALRWNARDPMFRVFDDYGNLHAQDAGTTDAIGWIAGEGAKDLPALLESLEHRFAIARLVEALLPLIATQADYP